MAAEQVIPGSSVLGWRLPSNHLEAQVLVIEHFLKLDPLIATARILKTQTGIIFMLLLRLWWQTNFVGNKAVQFIFISLHIHTYTFKNPAQRPNQVVVAKGFSEPGFIFVLTSFICIQAPPEQKSWARICETGT